MALRDAVLRWMLRSLSAGTSGRFSLHLRITSERWSAMGLPVRASLANMKRLHARSPVSRLATKAFFRLSDWSPWLSQVDDRYGWLMP